MGLVSWRRTTRLLPCILTLLRCAESAFDIRTAKSETKGEKCRTMLSAGWCDRPRGKAKHDFFWDMLFGPHNFTVWRYRIHWAVRSPGFTTSESSLWLDLENEVCAIRSDLPKKWKSALQREMEHISMSDSDGHYGKVGRSRIRFPMVSLEFLIDVILPAAL